ncbi:radical SAM/SPASM domain-containing protein [Paenibacillus amylolyticus]|uniref:Radical SAM domain protein n=1 Tax=Paenibacillus amylolyticus TaxID=1451 RepID=A0A100VQ08_PAEAM|nr:radical SAM protein [Paenibacillus amylolyticus]GAS83758.1 radical SAM domain protein [Paenibacillus amylolyticus]
MRIDERLHIPNVAVYYEDGHYVVHNVQLNCWVVYTPSEYEIASELVYGGKTVSELMDSGLDAQNVKRIARKMLMYRVAYQGEKPEEYNVLDTLQKQGMGKVAPTAIYFVTTYKCNLSCIYCYADSSPERSMNGDMNTEEAKDMIRQIKDLGTSTIVFTGGEAFIRKDIMELMTYSKEIGLRVNVISNGTLINSREKVNEIAKVIDLFTISFDSMDKDEHEANRGKNTWDRARKAIDLLLEAGVKMKINQTVTKHNKDSIDPLLEFATERSIRLNIVPLATLGRGDERMQGLSFAERRRISDRMLDIEMDDAHEDCHALNVKQYERRRHCGHGTSEFSIDAKGNVFPCKLMHSPMFHAGSIREKSLREIWETSEVFERSRNRTVHTLPECMKCTFRESCGGGCRAFHWGATGDADGTFSQDCSGIRRGIRRKMVAYFQLTGGKTNESVLSNS